MSISRSVSYAGSACLPHRCAKCFARVTLPKKLADYIRPPVCKQCGHKTLFLDKYRQRKERGSVPRCNCEGYWFPHRKGSKYCFSNPMAYAHWGERADA